jgi:hypothetical protein
VPVADRPKLGVEVIENVQVAVPLTKPYPDKPRAYTNSAPHCTLYRNVFNGSIAGSKPVIVI